MKHTAILILGGALALAPGMWAQTANTDQNQGTANQTQNNGTNANPGAAGQNNTGTTGGAATTPNNQNYNTPDQNNSNNNQGTTNQPASPNMPKTGSGWLAMLLSGSLLAGAGFEMRRRAKA